MSPDDDLRKLFATLRERDLRVAPAFEAPRVPAPSRWRGSAMRWAIAAAAVASLAILVGRPARQEPPVPSPSLSAWRAPTDFLLKTPGFEMLTLGPRWPPLPASKGRPPAERRRPS